MSFRHLLLSSRRLGSSSKSSFYVPYKLSPIQRAFLIPYFGLGAIADPTRGDLVAGLGDTTGQLQLEHIETELKRTECGRRLLTEKPLITKARMNMTALESLNEGTLGRGYHDYMIVHGFDADERSTVRYISNPDTAYVMARYRQVHDFWHVLCDLPPTVLGELALKWFEFKVTALPICAFSGVLGPLKLTLKEQEVLLSVYLPWALRASSRCDELLTYRYEDNVHRSVEDIRYELNIEPAPKVAL